MRNDIKYNRVRALFLLGIYLMICMLVKGQVQNADRKQLMKIGGDYKSYFIILPVDSKQKDVDFARLFTMDTVHLDNDYRVGAGFSKPSHYYADIKLFLNHNGAVKGCKIKMSPLGKMFYAKRGNEYFIWLLKVFDYQFQRQPRHYAFWEELVLRKVPGKSMRITAIHLLNEAPPDSDLDRVPDEWDLCPGTPIGVTPDLHGCVLRTDSLYFLHEQVIRDSIRAASRLKQIREDVKKSFENGYPGVGDTVTHHEIKAQKPESKPSSRRRPFTRLSLSFEGGFGGDGNARLLKQTYTGNISFHWQINALLGLGAGTTFCYMPMDDKALQNEVSRQLSGRYSAVSVHGYAWRLPIFQGIVSIGTYHWRRNMLEAGFLAEIACPGIFSKNIATVSAVNNEGTVQSVQAVMSIPSFWLFGPQVMIQQRLGDRTRLQLTGNYWWGSYAVKSMEVGFDGNLENIALPRQAFKLTALSLGLNFTL